MRSKEIKRVLLIILTLNWFVAFSKILLGFFTGTLSILSDGIHSLFDGATNIAGFFGVRFAEKPADENHPYGHQKYEAIASQIILFFLIIAAWEIGRQIFEKISSPTATNPDISWFTFAVLFCCLIIDIFVARYEFKKGKKLKSTILRADAMHTKSHYITTGAVILGTGLIKIGAPVIIDPIIASFVVLFIVKLASDIFKETSLTLSDGTLLGKEKIEKIQKIAKSMDGVKSCHKIRNRGDENCVFLDVHVIVADSNFTLEKAHEICHRLSNEIQKQMPEIKDITIHPEPK